MVKHLLRALAQESAIKTSLCRKDKEKKKKKEAHLSDEPVITYHTMEVNGKPFRFKATAGYLLLKDETHKVKTRIFFISYEKGDVKDFGKRPITFAFNGGPGAASAWVHFGAMGPKRIKLTEEGEILPPPFSFEDNEYTWLDFTDLVFVDPVGTGFSYYEKDEDPMEFYGVKEDIKWAGDFIRLYITRNKRWLSPKYMAGESYGTYRAVGLAEYLKSHHALDLNGIIFISSALDYQAFDFDSGSDIPYILFLPAYTATAWYHGRLEPELQKDLYKTLKEAEEWTVNHYSVALLKGDALPASERTEIIKQMARFTALPEAYIDKCNLRVKRSYFLKQLLHDEKQVVGVYDSRLKAADINPSAEEPKTDPSMFNIYGACIATLNAYLRHDLKYENDLPYLPISRQVSNLWNWRSGIEGDMGYVNITDTLLEVMGYNKYFRVFFASGYFDLCTPYYSTTYIVNHLGVPPALKDNITVKYYEGGHMMYVHLPSRKKLFDEVKSFCLYGIDSEK